MTQVWERLFLGLTAVCALGTGGLLLAIVGVLFVQATPAIRAFGGNFLLGQVWNPVQGQYGILPQVWGTVLTAGLSLSLAVPLGGGVAIGLTESWAHLRQTTACHRRHRRQNHYS